jgi:hypothetical protein
MSKGNTFENDWLKLVFNGTGIANIADNAAASPLTNLFVALHTADPGEAGDQTTSEAAYTGYARVAVARSSGGWTVTGNQAVNVATITFPNCTAGTSTITHWSIGVATSGASKILYSGPIAGAQVIGTGKASNDTVTLPGHGLIVNDQVAVVAIPGATLPGGLTDGQLVFVKTVSGNDITLSTTQGGSLLDITADGALALQKEGAITISTTVTPPTIAAGALKVNED